MSWAWPADTCERNDRMRGSADRSQTDTTTSDSDLAPGRRRYVTDLDTADILSAFHQHIISPPPGNKSHRGNVPKGNHPTKLIECMLLTTHCAHLRMDRHWLVDLGDWLYTVFRKNTPLRFLLYFRFKCLDFHKVFRECSEVN